MRRFMTSVFVVAAGLLAAGCGTAWWRSATVVSGPAPVAAPKVDTDAAIAHYVKAQGLTDTEALVELSRATRADPTLSVAHAATGDIHRRHGNAELARQAYENACKVNPYYFKSHYNLGVVYQQLANETDDDTLFEKYLRRACEIYLRAHALNRKDYDTTLNLGACYFQLGRYSQAEEYCRAAIAIDDDRPQAWCNLAIIYDNQNKLAEAIDAYQQSLEREVNQPRLHMNLAASYLRQGRVRDAIGSFQMAAERDPTLIDPHLHIGVCYYRLKELDNALASYDRAVELAPTNAEAWRGMGVVYMAMYLADKEQTECRDKALESWKRSLQFKPKQPDLAAMVERYAEGTPDDEEDDE